MRPRLLDSYCCQGGASAGYRLAGFDVEGVDVVEQPLYPWTFHQADALDFIADNWQRFDAIHASPPCHDHSNLGHIHGSRGTGHLLDDTIKLLRELPIPWVVENVVSPTAEIAMRGAGTVCGRAVGIRELRRHRLFLTSFPLWLPPCKCRRDIQPLGVYGKLTVNEREDHKTRKASIAQARAMFETPWMDKWGLAQAVPARYTEIIGRQLRAHVARAAASE